MFKSRQRPIVIPQSEHLKLAGSLALLWGNVDFDPPPFPQLSFVEGVGLHDRGYGYLDTLPVGGAAEADWLAVTRRGFYLPCSDPAADLITRLHLRRLVSSKSTPGCRALLQEMEHVIDQQFSQYGLSPAVFERADRITNFCDRVSFDFCFEQPTEGEVLIYAHHDNQEGTGVQYRIEGSLITLAPWPLSAERCSGYLVGYQAEGYPARLEPVIVPYTLVPAD